MSDPLMLSLRNVSKSYTVKRSLFGAAGQVHALRDISFDLPKGATLAVIGESGCGKTTLAKQILGIENPDAGEIIFQDNPIHTYQNRPKALIRQIQLVFQNPYSSLNPRQTVYSALEGPLLIHSAMTAAERQKNIYELLEHVGLQPDHARRYPHMFSGGQRQRIAIARAIILNPALLILDEPVSALDLSVQAQVLNLLKRLRQQFSLTYIFVTHDISIIRFVAEHIMVMYLGRCVEFGKTADVLEHPKHPYTQALLSASPTVSVTGRKERITLTGEIPSPLNPPAGCPFITRCPLSLPQCRTAFPPRSEENGHSVFCYAAMPESLKTA